MIRFFQIARVLPVPIFSSKSVYNVHRILCSHRFYSKGKQPPKGPLYSKSDCTPPTRPPTCSTQLYQDKCQRPPPPPPPQKSTCPPPCEVEEMSQKTYKRLLALGILATLLALGGLYYFSREERQKKVPTHQKHQPAKCLRRKVLDKSPKDSSEIPTDVPYLIIGGGTAAFSAFRAIKSADPLARVLMVSKDCRFPYMRPPLSKEIWYNDDPAAAQKLTFKQWNGSERSLFYEPDDFYVDCKELLSAKNGGVAVALGWHVDKLDVINHQVHLENGPVIHYGKCLIATGSTPKNLGVFSRAIEDPKIADRIFTYRTIEDFKELHASLKESKAVAIIGGGFLGSELACALSRKGKSGLEVHQIFREGGNMAHVLPEYLSQWTTKKVEQEGVDVVPYSEVYAVGEKNDGKLEIFLTDKRVITVDQVIVAVGVRPNTELAKSSDLEVDPVLGGYLVNTELQARTDVYIAGDCVSFYDAKLGRRRIEHHDHAVVSGRLAGENMTGAAKPYLHQSMFWSDLGPDVGFEAIGLVDSSLPTVGVFAKATEKDTPAAVVAASDEGIRSIMEEGASVPPECKKYENANDIEAKRQGDVQCNTMHSPVKPTEDFGKGVIFYLRNDVVVGIVLWNVFNRMSVARQVLDEGRKYDDLNEVAKLFNIHDE